MDSSFKVGNIQAALAAPVDNKVAAQAADDSFKFMLISNIAESELQEKLSTMMGHVGPRGLAVKITAGQQRRKYGGSKE